MIRKKRIEFDLSLPSLLMTIRFSMKIQFSLWKYYARSLNHSKINTHFPRKKEEVGIWNWVLKFLMIKLTVCDLYQVPL